VIFRRPWNYCSNTQFQRQTNWQYQSEKVPPYHVVQEIEGIGFGGNLLLRMMSMMAAVTMTWQTRLFTHIMMVVEVAEVEHHMYMRL
jgi:hypothetical protein